MRTPPINFRLDARTKAKLVKRAEIEGYSMSALIRKIVTDALDQDGHTIRTEKRLAQVEDSIKELDLHLSAHIKAILKLAGVEEDELDRWISEYMRPLLDESCYQ